MLYAFNDAKAGERHETQYFEMFCNRGIYHKGWTAVTRHGVPWVGPYDRAFDDDVWELYDTNTDWTQSKDLAKENPKKLAELQRLFLIEATKYSVLPLDDRSFERFNADISRERRRCCLVACPGCLNMRSSRCTTNRIRCTTNRIR
jgi:arylsulfatase